MNMKKNNDDVLAKTTVDMFMWLGEEGEAIEVSEEDFERMQREWTGQRPNNNVR